MTHHDWLRAMTDEPADDLVRLAFADWLDERGEADRAAWVRLSVEESAVVGRVGPDHPEAAQARRRSRRALARCRPAWARPDGRRMFFGDRGLLFLYYTGSYTVADMVRARWPAKAVAECWLDRIEFSHPDAALVGEIVAAWRGRLRGVPFHVSSVSKLRAKNRVDLFSLPDLAWVDLDAEDLCGTAGEAFQGASAFAGVSVDLTTAKDREVRAAFDRIAWLTALRRLWIYGRTPIPSWDVPTPRPVDEDILRLAGHPALRRLELLNCDGVTAAGVAALVAATPGLVVVRE